MSNKRNNDDNNGLGCALMLLGIIVAMPLVGIYLLTQSSDEDKATGAFLLILGVIIWAYVLTHS